MNIFYILSLLVFLFLFLYVELFVVRNMKKEICKLKGAVIEKQQNVNYFKKLYEKTDKELYEKRMTYEKELENFKKILKLQGHRIDYDGDGKYVPPVLNIPYYLNESKAESDDFVELREEYIIPEIRVCFGECWDKELYKSIEEEERLKNGK